MSGLAGPDDYVKDSEFKLISMFSFNVTIFIVLSASLHVGDTTLLTLETLNSIIFMNYDA